jgi:pimeloyl-ACP methyl ester carboxylesterase
MHVGPQRVDIDAGSVPLVALDYGNADAPPLVLLHGHADLAWSMAPLAEALAGRYHVVAPDLRGHGDSGHPGAYSVLHYVADLVATCDALGFEAPTLVAHSLGGHVAAQFAGLFPDRVSALVLIEGLGPPSARPPASPATRADAARNAVELLRTPLRHKPLAGVGAATRRLVEAHPRLDPARAATLAELGTRAGPDGGLVWKFDPRTRDWVAGMDHEATEALWAQVRCPVLVVDGADSWDTWWAVRVPMAQAWGRLGEEAWRERVRTFRDVRHVTIPDAGHMVHFDQPEALEAAVVAFLAERGPA